MRDSANELEEYVEYVKEMANTENDLARMEVRDCDIYRRLSKEYENLDELIDQLFLKADLAVFIEECLAKEWEELRMKHNSDWSEDKLADCLCFRVSIAPDDRYKRFNFRYGSDKMHELALKVIRAKPYDEKEVYAVEKAKYAKYHSRYGGKSVAQERPNGGGTNPMSNKRRLRDRLNDQDD